MMLYSADEGLLLLVWGGWEGEREGNVGEGSAVLGPVPEAVRLWECLSLLQSCCWPGSCLECAGQALWLLERSFPGATGLSAC